MGARQNQRGNAVIEFTLVGIGLVFVLISIFEMARGMWVYHTLAHTSKEITRYLIVHGEDCQKFAQCQTASTLGAIATKIRYEGVGLLPDLLEIRVYKSVESGTPVQVIGSANNFVLVSSLEGQVGMWDPFAGRGQSIAVDIRYPFRTALAMLWPGSGTVTFGVFNFGASSWDTVQF